MLYDLFIKLNEAFPIPKYKSHYLTCLYIEQTQVLELGVWVNNKLVRCMVDEDELTDIDKLISDFKKLTGDNNG